MLRFVSRFESLPKNQARLVFGFLALAILASVLIGILAPLKGPTAVYSQKGEGDIVLYQAIVDDMRRGEDYYAAATSELRNRGFSLRPAFNYRLPTLAMLQSSFETDLPALAIFGVLSWIAVCIWAMRFMRMGLHPIIGILLVAIFATGALLGGVFPGTWFHEVWAGVLIIIAFGLYGPGTWGLSALATILALLIREFALPVPVVFGAMALWNRRYLEASVWTLIVMTFGALLSLHLHTANQFIQADDLQNSWSSLGGWNFFVSTARWNAMFLDVPNWLRSIVAVIALFGLAGWKHPIGARALLTMAAWAFSFSFIGRANNHYWGLIYSPILAVGLGLAPLTLGALARSAFRPSEAALA